MENIIAIGGTFLLGVGAVSAVILKYGPKVTKWLKVAMYAVDIANDWMAYIQIDTAKGETKPTLNEDEVKELIADFQKIQAEWKA